MSASEPGGLRAEGQQRPVVVQHLLEVRDHPLAVHRVAAEAAPQVVVDPAERHLGKGVHAHVQVPRVAVAAEAPFDVGGMGELGRPPEPAVAGVEGAAQPRHRPFQGLGVHRARGAGPARLRPREGVAQRLVLPRDLLPVRTEEVHHPQQQIAERGQAVARRGREVGAAEEGGEVVGGEEHGERPAAGAPREELVRHLVDLVEVGTLLAVHLDVDEVGVHHLRGRLVLERFVGHDVAPVAGGVADGEEDRPVLRSRPLERFRSPRMPVHRIVGVLQEIGAGLGGETIAARRCWRVHGAFPVRGVAGGLRADCAREPDPGISPISRRGRQSARAGADLGAIGRTIGPEDLPLAYNPHP